MSNTTLTYSRGAGVTRLPGEGRSEVGSSPPLRMFLGLTAALTTHELFVDERLWGDLRPSAILIIGTGIGCGNPKWCNNQTIRWRWNIFDQFRRQTRVTGDLADEGHCEISTRSQLTLIHARKSLKFDIVSLEPSVHTMCICIILCRKRV